MCISSELVIPRFLLPFLIVNTLFTVVLAPLSINGHEIAPAACVNSLEPLHHGNASEEARTLPFGPTAAAPPKRTTAAAFKGWLMDTPNHS